MPRQIGWSQESNLLYDILMQLDRLLTVAGGGGGLEIYPTLAAFPPVGDESLIYLAQDTNKIYYWDIGTLAYVEMSPGLTSVGLTMPSAFTVTNSPLTSNGTIAVTGAGTAAQYVRGDGVLAPISALTSGGGSVNYFLNGSVNQGTFGGNTYYELNKVPVYGAGTSFNRNTDGLIASFITDAGDPSLLAIPAGSWTFELYMNASTNLGTPSFYVELYKYDGVSFTLIASNSGTPDPINNGTITNLYITTLSVPGTVLTLTDRLAVQVYVNVSGNTINLFTEDGTLCEIMTTFSAGITSLNGLNDQVQFLGTGTTGTDFNIVSATNLHTFNLPVASAVNTGKLSAADWNTFNTKAVEIVGAGVDSTVRCGVSNTASGNCSAALAGSNNTASNNFSSVVGGFQNNVTSCAGFIGGGCCNTVSSNRSTIGGGFINSTVGSDSFIGGGTRNVVNSSCATVSGGNCNCIGLTSVGATVGGGQSNLANSSFGFIGSGICNSVCNNTSGCLALGAVVVGGVGNNTCGGLWDLATCAFFSAPTLCNAGLYSFIGGGFQNMASGSHSAVLGGQQNRVCGTNSLYSSITGGRQNTTCLWYNLIGAGFTNTITSGYGGIVAGRSNTISSPYSFIGSGCLNTVSSGCAAVVAGCSNVASALTTFVGGGGCNTASGAFSSIGSGFKNLVHGQYAFVGTGICNNVCNSGGACFALGAVVVGGVGNNTTGGTWDFASCSFTVAPTICNAGIYSFVGGGFQNQATSCNSVIVGGQCNSAPAGGFSFIGGGFGNIACGTGSLVVGGTNNAACGCVTTVLSGACNTASSSYATVLSSCGGLAYGYGQVVVSPRKIAAAGDAQDSITTLYRSQTLTTGGTAVLFLDGTSATFIPNGNNRVWNVKVRTVAVVTSISGTATGVSVGNSFAQEDFLLFKRIGGTSSVVGTSPTAQIYDTSMSTAALAFTAGASQELVITFTAPTFTGGGSLAMRVVSEVHLVETAY